MVGPRVWQGGLGGRLRKQPAQAGHFTLGPACSSKANLSASFNFTWHQQQGKRKGLQDNKQR